MQKAAVVPLIVSVSARSDDIRRWVFEEHSRALADYRRRIEELLADGFVRDGGEAFVYGTRWSQALHRGDQRVTVELSVEA